MRNFAVDQMILCCNCFSPIHCGKWECSLPPSCAPILSLNFQVCVGRGRCNVKIGHMHITCNVCWHRLFLISEIKTGNLPSDFGLHALEFMDNKFHLCYQLVYSVALCCLEVVLFSIDVPALCGGRWASRAASALFGELHHFSLQLPRFSLELSISSWLP